MGSLEQLAWLVGLFWVAVALFVIVVLGTIMRVLTGLAGDVAVDLTTDTGGLVHAAE